MDTGTLVPEIRDAVDSSLGGLSKEHGKFIAGSGNIPTGTYSMAPHSALLAAISLIILR